MSTWLRETVLLIAGATLYGLGVDGFIVANHLAEGGVGGIAILIHYASGWPVGILYLALNAPLYILGWIFVGRRFILRTLAGSALVAAALLAFAKLQFPMQDLLLASLYGGAFVGTGLGLMFLSDGSSGGFDIVARFAKDKFGTPVAQTFLLGDALVIGASGLLYGANTALYALIVTLVGGLLVDRVQEGPYRAKAALIITRETEKLTRWVVAELDRGVTEIGARGGYTGEPRPILLVVVNRAELTRLKEAVRRLDPNAFVLMTDVAEVMGLGFGLQTGTRTPK